VTEAPDTAKPETLKQKVLKRAEMIRSHGQGIPDPPMATPVQMTEPE
jgi:hypothetical protein